MNKYYKKRNLINDVMRTCPSKVTIGPSANSEDHGCDYVLYSNGIKQTMHMICRHNESLDTITRNHIPFKRYRSNLPISNTETRLIFPIDEISRSHRSKTLIRPSRIACRKLVSSR